MVSKSFTNAKRLLAYGAKLMKNYKTAHVLLNYSFGTIEFVDKIDVKDHKK